MDNNREKCSIMAENLEYDWLRADSNPKWTIFYNDLKSAYGEGTLKCKTYVSEDGEPYGDILYEVQKYRQLIAWGALHMDAFRPYLNDPEGFCRLSHSMLICFKYNATVTKDEPSTEFIPEFLRQRNTKKVWDVIKRHIESLHRLIGTNNDIRIIENITHKYLEEHVLPYHIQNATEDIVRNIRSDLEILSRPLCDETVLLYIHRIYAYMGVIARTPESARHLTEVLTDRETLLQIWTWPMLDEYIKLLFVSVLLNKPRPIITYEKYKLDFMKRHLCFNYNPDLPNKNLWRYRIHTTVKELELKDMIYRIIVSDEEDEQLIKPGINQRKRIARQLL